MRYRDEWDKRTASGYRRGAPRAVICTQHNNFRQRAQKMDYFYFIFVSDPSVLGFFFSSRAYSLTWKTNYFDWPTKKKKETTS